MCHVNERAYSFSKVLNGYVLKFRYDSTLVTVEDIEYIRQVIELAHTNDGKWVTYLNYTRAETNLTLCSSVEVDMNGSEKYVGYKNIFHCILRDKCVILNAQVRAYLALLCEATDETN